MTGGAGMPQGGVAGQPTFTPSPPRAGEGMPREAAPGRPVVHMPPPTSAPPDDAATVLPGSGQGASSHWDHAAPPDGAKVEPSPAPGRPQIPLPASPAAADATGPGPATFPEPLVIGPMPTLRSDPKGLPHPDQVPGPVVPDTVLDGADLDGLLIRGASLRGDRHRYEATVRQDAMGIWQVGDSETAAVLVCVTDGVSSEPLSHRGAAEACRLLRDAIALEVSDLFKAWGKRRVKPVWENIAQDICVRLTAVAGYLGVTPKALSTTLAAALIETNPRDPKMRRFVILNVGDATAFHLIDREFIPLLEDPHDAAITSTATNALPTSLGDVGVDTGILAPGEVLMVCTDGMSNPMRNADVREQLAEWWGFGSVPSMPEFGWQMSYRAKTYDDDRTAICVWGR
jgi:serine/threonine protein phosphatase PrpC